jgi:hypothetical protein
MGRVTTRVQVPIRKPNEFLDLTNKIVAKHTELGKESPLNSLKQVDMASFKKKVEEAIKLRTESEKLRKQSESLMEKAQTVIGVSPNQNSLTPGTLYNTTNTIKEYLLVLNKANEEELGDWGFNVVTKKAASPKKKPAKP